MANRHVPHQQFYAMSVDMYPRNEPVELHTHSGPEFYLCAKGGGYQYTPNHRQTMQEGNLYIFPGGTPHIGAGDQSSGCVGHVLNVNNDAFTDPIEGESKRLLDQLCQLAHQQHYLIPVSPQSEPILRELFQSLITEHREKSHGFRIAIREQFNRLLLTLLRDPTCGPHLTRAVKPANNTERLAGVLRFCRLHYNQHITVEAMAERAGLSRSRFHALFREETGRSLIEYITALRLEAAKKYLSTTDRSTLDIALEVGFGSLSQFYDRFKAQVGITPTTYRAEVP